ncbi:MAG TPA: tetratricopeptide repeat protein [Burkholderiaceae bacterium]
MRDPFFSQPDSRTRWIALALLILAVCALYGPFLNNPLVFDDFNFFNSDDHTQFVDKLFSFDLRWLPNASFEWPRRLIKQDMIPQRGINLGLHCANALLLIGVLHALLQLSGYTQRRVEDGVSLAPWWMAYFAALLFAMHPAAVYAVAYLVQRTSLLAGFFTLLMWLALLRGLASGKTLPLLASVVAYALATLCKEHAIMAPAVAGAIVLLGWRSGRLDKQRWKRLALVFALYAGVALYIVYKLKSANIIGNAYQANGRAMLLEYARRDPGFDMARAFPLSMLTQTCLYFKYLLVWALPLPAWMSVDMIEAFALHFVSWRLAGLGLFLLYPLAALALLWRGGRTGLFGLAMLCPWLMFLTEVSTVRIQEIFVLYRTYLWMPVALLAVPLAMDRIKARRAAVLLLMLTAVLVPLSYARLQTFTHHLLLWDDAARLATESIEHQGMERIFKNRALAFLELKQYDAAIEDNTTAIRQSPTDFIAHNNRGATYFEMGRYQLAMADYNKALQLHPAYTLSYLGRARTLEALGNKPAALEDYKSACRGGYKPACDIKLR